MKTPPSPRLRRRRRPQPLLYSRRFLASFLVLAGVSLAATSLYATIRHPPLVSWIPDQRITDPMGSFATQYFRIIDHDGGGTVQMKQSSNSGFYGIGKIMVNPCTDQTDFDAGCAEDGTGFKVEFSPITSKPMQSTATTITLRAVENGSGGLIGYTSFTLRCEPSMAPTAANPPSIANLPNYAVQVDSSIATYETMFAIGDLDSDGMEDIYDDDTGQMRFVADDFTLHSTNTALLADTDIHVEMMPPELGLEVEEGPRLWKLTATTNSSYNYSGNPATTTVWLDLVDPEGNYTSTSFVLTAVPANTPPTITNTNSKTFEEQMLPQTSVSHKFTLADDSSTSELKVTASSSNTNLVPNDGSHLTVGIDGDGDPAIVVTPAEEALPGPSPGRPQAATITLSVTDDAYTRQTTFLYVLAPPAGGIATAFSRPGGVYSLEALDRQRPFDSFLSGEQHGSEVSWHELETAAPDMAGDHFDWNPIYDVITNLPPGQQLSLNLQTEPCYIADSTSNTWCDTATDRQPTDCTSCTLDGAAGILRAVPWDDYLRTRRDHFLQQLAEHLTASQVARISVINPNLPGGETGLEPPSVDVNDMPGYSREALLKAAEDEIRTVQEYFPQQFVQFGLYKINDNQGPDGDDTYDDNLWEWLYRNATGYRDAEGYNLVSLADEFNGIDRPRVSFFQENLAATRTSDVDGDGVTRSSAPNYIAPPNSVAYTITPHIDYVPPFAYMGPNEVAPYNNAITYQATTSWVRPYMREHGEKFFHTVNGSPNDGLEGAFNAYICQYLEVYVPDIDQAQPPGEPPSLPTLNATLWAGELQSWKDYTDSLRDRAPLEAPAGLTVERDSSTSNVVKWFAVYDDPDHTSQTSYQLQHFDLSLSPQAWVDVCNSTETQCTDTASTGEMYAYRVRAKNTSTSNPPTPWSYVAVFLSEDSYDGYVNFNGTTKTPNNNAAQPGIRTGRGTTGDLRGFLSFDTSALGPMTVRGAKLRLKQTTGNAAFDAFGACLVDVKNGEFNGSEALEGADYDAPEDGTNVTQLAGVGSGNWAEAALYAADAAAYINTDDRTQFRLRFPQMQGASSKLAGWNSGESTDDPAQLIVRYEP